MTQETPLKDSTLARRDTKKSGPGRRKNQKTTSNLKPPDPSDPDTIPLIKTIFSTRIMILSTSTHLWDSFHIDINIYCLLVTVFWIPLEERIIRITSIQYYFKKKWYTLELVIHTLLLSVNTDHQMTGFTGYRALALFFKNINLVLPPSFVQRMDKKLFKIENKATWNS